LRHERRVGLQRGQPGRLRRRRRRCPAAAVAAAVAAAAAAAFRVACHARAQLQPLLLPALVNVLVALRAAAAREHGVAGHGHRRGQRVFHLRHLRVTATATFGGLSLNTILGYFAHLAWHDDIVLANLLKTKKKMRKHTSEDKTNKHKKKD
jgi:hypothetical protein